MLIKCGRCGLEYELNSGENVSDFQCTCGGNLEQRRSIADFRKQQETTPTINTGHKSSFKKTINDYKKDIIPNQNKNEYEKVNLSFEGQKRDLLSRGYNLIDENNKELIYKKDVSVLPLWLVILITIFTFPIGLLVGPLLYYFWRKPKLKTVEKKIEKDGTRQEVLVL